MRNAFLASFALGFCLVRVAPLHCEDSTDPKAVVDKALSAMGGEDKLAKFKAANFKAKGIFKPFGDAEFTAEYFIQLPKQSKNVTKFDIMGMMHSMTRTVNGDSGWMIFRGKVQDMPADQFAQQKDELYGNWVATILPLKGPDFKLTSLGEVKVNEKPAVGIKVSHERHNDVSLYFDKESGLLAKSVRRARGPGGKEAETEFYYSAYKDFDGIKQYTKMVVKSQGKELADTEITDFKLLE